MTETAMKSSPLPLGPRLREALKAKRMTIVALAHALELNPRTVAGWLEEPPRSKPSYEKLVRIARLLEHPVSYFIDEEAA